MYSALVFKYGAADTWAGWLKVWATVVFEPSAGCLLAVAMTASALILGMTRLRRLR
jgi:hypothetical protein